MIEEHGTSWFQLVFVYKGQDAHIVFTADRCGHNSVIIIYYLLQSAHGHRRSSQFIHLSSLFLIIIKGLPQM